MRVDWQQQLEGCTLLEIRDIFRATRDAYVTVELVARKLEGAARFPRKATRERADRLIRDLLASGLIEPDTDPKPKPGSFELTDAGRSLRAARATKRFKRERADKAVAGLLEAVSQINADPVSLHTIAWVAVYGSYITSQPDLGDIDVAIDLKAREGTIGIGRENRDALREAFLKKYPPPDSADNFMGRLFWPETFTRRRLRVDKAMQIIDRGELEEMGCPYRVIYPNEQNVRAKPGWSGERIQIILRKD